MSLFDAFYASGGSGGGSSDGSVIADVVLTYTGRSLVDNNLPCSKTNGEIADMILSGKIVFKVIESEVLGFAYAQRAYHENGFAYIRMKYTDAVFDYKTDQDENDAFALPKYLSYVTEPVSTT